MPSVIPTFFTQIQTLRESETEVSLAEIAAWCEALAQRIRGGDTLRNALVETHSSPSIETALGGFRLRIERGADLISTCTAVIDATNAQPASTHIQTLREIMGLIRVCALGSSRTAQTLDRAAHNLRIRAALADEVARETASARLSASLLTALPIVAVAITLMISPEVAQTYTTTAGLVCMTMCLLLNLIGWWWIRRLITAAQR
jgi:Flp pilus assembly protein TadB